MAAEARACTGISRIGCMRMFVSLVQFGSVLSLFDEDDGPSRGELGSRHADTLYQTLSQVAANVLPRNRVEDEALEGLGVEQAEQSIRPLSSLELARQSPDAQEFPRQADQTARREAEDLIDLQITPDID